MAFAFTAEQRERLFDALGRRDSGAWHLTEDVELAIEGYGDAELSSLASPEARTIDLGQLLAQVSALRPALYDLPQQARRMAAMNALAGEDADDIARLAQASGEALDQLSAGLARVTIAAEPAPSPVANAEHFVRAVGQAFRNRMNLKPTSDARSLFRRFLDTLMMLVQRRHADLDELSRVLTEDRLARILGAD